MDFSFIQEAHSWLRLLFPVGRDAQYILAGFTLVFLTMVISRRGFSSLWVVVPCLLFTALVEILDILDFGLRYGMTSLGDFLLGNIITFLLVLGTRLGWVR